MYNSAADPAPGSIEGSGGATEVMHFSPAFDVWPAAGMAFGRRVSRHKRDSPGLPSEDLLLVAASRPVPREVSQRGEGRRTLARRNKSCPKAFVCGMDFLKF